MIGRGGEDQERAIVPSQDAVHHTLKVRGLRLNREVDGEVMPGEG